MTHFDIPGEQTLVGGQCISKDPFGKWRTVNILAARVSENAPNTEIFIHFRGFDKKWDRWTDIGHVRKLQLPRDASENADGDEEKTRRLRRLEDEQLEDSDEVELKIKNQHEQRTKIKNITHVQFGEWELETWYYSPYPERMQLDKQLYVCDMCFYYTNERKNMKAHLHGCNLSQPPGRRIYLQRGVAIYEVNGGSTNVDVKTYSQCLCLFSKLFMDNKTIYFDVEEYFFYVLCEMDKNGFAKPVGYFSKQKNEPHHNLSCLVVFPPYSRQGYGSMLIQLSYILSRRNCLVAGPEKPLSELGTASYQRYWTWAVAREIGRLENNEIINVDGLSKRLGMNLEDVQDTLERLQLTTTKEGTCTFTWARFVELTGRVVRPPKLQINPRHLDGLGRAQKRKRKRIDSLRR
ncbi:unnamed protein product, partial [Mesorhabditis spiculigera]